MISVRPAAPDDFDAVCRILGEGDALHATALPDRFQVTTPSRDRRFYDEYLTNPRRALLVAASDDDVVGVAELHLVRVDGSPPVRARRYVEVVSVVVAAGQQRRGVGLALMRSAERWATDNEASAIELNVYAFNTAARRWYEELGYQPLSERLRRALS